MKNNLTILLLLSSSFLFTSCKKLLDEVGKNPGVLNSKITKIIYSSEATEYLQKGDYDRTTYFNNAGEPTKSVVVNSFTGNSNQAFFYNAKGFLTKWIYYFGEEPTSSQKPGAYNIFAYHGYSHDKAGNILTDTTYVNTYLQYISYYSYDSYGRIVKVREVSSYNPVNIFTETFYSYGSDGNLKGYAYDNKLHFRRLSKTLMFLSRDYSVNNRIKPEVVDPYADNFSFEYGKFSLPVIINGPKLIPDEGGVYKGHSSILYN